MPVCRDMDGYSIRPDAIAKVRAIRRSNFTNQTKMKLKLKLKPFKTILALAVVGFSAHAVAQTSYPDHPIRFIVPFTSGGNTDVVARIVGKGMTEQLKNSVVVENKPGANAMIGAEYVARLRPDGYTMLLATAETHAINPHIYKKINYDAIKDFSAVGVIGSFPFALVINPKLPVNTLAEFVAYAKAHKGQLTFSSWGIGSTSQIAFEQFKQVTGVDMRHIPFQGAAPAITAVEAGNVDAFMVPLTVAVPQANSGHVKLLAITGAKRENSAPTIPTMTELGYPVVIGGWHVLAVPKATPRAIVLKLNAALNAAIGSKDIREVLQKQGIDPADTTPDEADKMVRSEWQRWGKITAAAHISVD
jgi:tripartite-type tricarboxylate transporter receptor subunit TctC